MGRLYEIAGNTGTTRLLMDGDALSAEYDAAGTLLRRYVHGADIAADDPIAWYEGTAFLASNERHLRSDWQGSIVLTAEASNGSVIAVNRYDEYGIPQAGNVGRFGYTGQAYVRELGMYYYKARMYSATLGRFMQTDPIGYEDGMNWYNYAGSDPVNGMDPSGTQSCWTAACEIVVVAPRSPKFPRYDPRSAGAGAGSGNGSAYFNLYASKLPPPLPQVQTSTIVPCKQAGCLGWNAPKWACPVGINDRNYPVPAGFSSAGLKGNRFVRDSNGVLQMNPNYRVARSTASGFDIKGAAADFIKIVAGVAFPLRNGPIESGILGPMGLVSSAGAKTAWSLIPKDRNCIEGK